MSFRIATLGLPLMMALICAPCANAAADAVNIGSRLQLFVDHHLIESSSGDIALRLHHPQRREVVLTFDAPWEGPQSGYMTILRDGDEYRLYYRGGGDLTTEQACLATSRDGIHFTRPKLGLFDFEGSRDNNIVYKPKEKSYREAHNFAPFIDTRPGCPPAQRYKAVGLGRLYDERGEGRRVLNALVSPDGIRWKKLRDEPVMTDGSFDSLNTIFYDTNLGKYACYLRAGRDGKRQVQRAVSDDLVNWSKPQWIEYRDTKGNPPPLEQFYTNGITPYFREPSIYIGLPMRFVPERKMIGADRRKIDGLSDAVFISSRDGLNFDRSFLEAFIRPGPDPLNWGDAHGNNTPAAGVVQTGAGEMSIYWAEHYGATPRVVRGTLRLDGFASLRAGATGGEIITPPIRFDGDRLVVNYATSATGSVGIDLQDEGGKPIPGFSFDNADELYGDESARGVTWSGKGDLSSLKGHPIRLRIRLRDADLFSLRSAAGP